MKQRCFELYGRKCRNEAESAHSIGHLHCCGALRLGGLADKSDNFADSVTNPMKPNSSEFTGKSGIGSK